MSACTKFAVATAQFATADAEKRLLNIKHFADVIPHLASLPQVAQKERCKPFSYRRHTAQFCQSTMQCGMQCVQISSIFMIFCDKNNTTFTILEILPKNNSKCFDLCIFCEIASFTITMIGLIPHICPGRHGRRLCKFFLAGVNFYRFNAKNWQFTV